MADVMTKPTPAKVEPPKANDTDKKPIAERKTEEAKPKTEPAEPTTIGSPDVFLMEHHKDAAHDRIRIIQVWADAEDRGYVIIDTAAGNNRKVGYVELHEGMERADAEKALNGAYDGTAVVL